MKINWEIFFQDQTRKIFENQKNILDIGGGLRIDKTKNNRFNQRNHDLYYELSRKVDYKIMDPVPDYNPDYVGDIHKMPFEDGQWDAIFCLAVLEHVEDPIRAVAECKRVLKKGGEAMFYIPFLYYYHAEVGYYKDFWRFTGDTCDMLFKDGVEVYERIGVRGRFGTLGRLTGVVLAEKIGMWLDKVVPKKSNQVSGWYIYIKK